MRKLPANEKKLRGTYRPDKEKVTIKPVFPKPDMTLPPEFLLDRMEPDALYFWTTMEPALTAAPYYTDADKIGLYMACQLSVLIDKLILSIGKANSQDEPDDTALRGKYKALCLLMDQYRDFSRMLGLDPLSRQAFEVEPPEKEDPLAFLNYD